MPQDQDAPVSAPSVLAVRARIRQEMLQLLQKLSAADVSGVNLAQDYATVLATLSAAHEAMAPVVFPQGLPCPPID